jgi:O-6-methylguanine DNA methyltransferase
MKKLYVHAFKTVLGTVKTAATEKGLAVVTLPGEPKGNFDKTTDRLFPDYERTQGGPVNRKAETQIKAYLAGRLKKFDLKLDLHASGFQRKALQRVARIPYGKTMTYAQIAEAVGNPKAYRAVGGANARNMMPLVIPCHRVVAASSLGGYGGGLSVKVKLLKMEGSL